jgi:hypothetical protein
MASLFKRAALAFGRFTGRRTRPESAAVETTEGMPLIEPVAVVTDVIPAEIATPAVEPIDELIEKSGRIPPLDESTTTPWDEALPKETEVTGTETSTVIAEADQGLAVTASLYETPASETSTVTPTVEASIEAPVATADAEIEPAAGAIVLTSVTPENIETPAAAPIEAVIETPAPVAEAAAGEPAKPAEAPAAAEPVIFSVEPVKGPVELKPEPSPAPLTTLSELYDLI